MVAPYPLHHLKRNSKIKSISWNKRNIRGGKSIRNHFSLNNRMKNMGGKKRLTLKQMERAQKKEERRKGSGGSASEKKVAGIILPDPRSKEVVDQLKKIRVLTPYTVATRFDLRLSVARDFLEELEKQGIVEFVSGSKNVKVYKPSD